MIPFGLGPYRGGVSQRSPAPKPLVAVVVIAAICVEVALALAFGVLTILLVAS